MIKEISKKELAKFSIYPDLNINCGMTSNTNLENINGYITVNTNIILEQDGVEYAATINKMFDKQGYLTQEDITKFLLQLKHEVGMIRSRANSLKINEDSEYIVFWRLTNE